MTACMPVPRRTWKGKAVEAPFGSGPGGFKEPHFVALSAPVADILRHHPDKGPQSIVVFHDQGQFDLPGVTFQTVAPGPVLGDRVDIGIIPEEAVFLTL